MEKLIAFPRYKNVTSYIVPSTVKTIDAAAMTRFVYLERVIIPDSVTLIKGAFLYETYDKIKEVIILRNHQQKIPDIWTNGAFFQSNFKLINITYIYSSQIVRSCKGNKIFSISDSYLLILIILC